MSIQVEHEAFGDGRLAVRRGTFFRSPALLMDGAVVRKSNGCYVVTDDYGFERQIDFRTSAFDPLPRVYIEGECIKLAPRLRWFEVAVALAPVALILVAGLLGGMIGLTAAYLNFTVLRGAGSRASKLTMMVVVTAIAFAVSLAATTALDAWMQQRFPNAYRPVEG